MVATYNKYSVYSPSEAAWYLNIFTQNIDRWLRINPNFNYKDPFKLGDKYIDFNDFIQLVAIKSLRLQGLSFRKIKTAFLTAKDIFKINILSSPNSLFHDNTGDIYIKINKNEELIQLTGKHKKQKNFNLIIIKYLTHITWSKDSHRPIEYYPLGEDKSIIMAPKISNGEPVVKSCMYKAITLYDSYLAENKDSKLVANLYHVKDEEVKQAYSYIKSLNKPPCRLKKAA